MPLQSRVPHPSLFPAGYRFRLVMMVSALVLIGLTIYNLRERSRAANAPHAARAAGPAPVNVLAADAVEKEGWQETVIPGPADDDPLEREKARDEFDAVVDREKSVESDKFAYWRLMKWARSLSFKEMQERAKTGIRFGQFWEDPEEHRGELVKMRLHVRRVIAERAPKNDLGVTRLYTVSGPTDESKSNPYIVVCFELAPGVPEGTEVFVDADFVGYFLKVFKYGGGDGKDRGAPMLIGRLQPVKTGRSVAVARQEGLLAMVAIGAAILLAAMLIVFLWQFTRKKRGPIPALSVPSLSTTDVEAWLERPGEMVAVPSEAAGSGSVPTNGQAKHAAAPPTPDSTDHVE